MIGNLVGIDAIHMMRDGTSDRAKDICDHSSE
jgi:hypothetical protein